MIRAGTVTRLAANIDLVIDGLVTTRFGVVVFDDISAVTLGATAIPVMINTRPMKRAVRSDGLLVFVDMIPTLTAFGCFTAIPSNA